MAAARKRIGHYVGPRDRVSREDLPRLDASGDWVAEVKHDGVWCLLEVASGRVVGLSSRVGLPLAAPGLLGEVIDPLKRDGLLVGELVADFVQGETCEFRSGTRRLHLFDVISWNGYDLRDLPLGDRREALERVAWAFYVNAATDRIRLVERRSSGFLDWYDELVTRAGDGSRLIGRRAEGLVLKRRGTPYRATCADGKVDFWLRCKPLSTVDYVVIGPDGCAEKGTPKVALGLWKETKDGFRIVKCMSPVWPDGLDLRPGMVVEVEGAEVFPSGAVRHGHVKRVREDKRSEGCTHAAAVSAEGTGG